MLKASLVVLTTACLAGAAFAQAPAPVSAEQRAEMERQREMQNATPDTPGSGAFPAMKEATAGLPDHVVYRPADLGAVPDGSLGVYAFGNGACSDDGASARLHMLEVASHGYVAIASGRIYSGPGAVERPAQSEPVNPLTDSPTRPEQLIEAIDWALAENARQDSPYFGKIDTDAVAVSGFSCGGIQALAVAADPRIKTAIIMNSGLFVEDPTEMGGMSLQKSLLRDLHFPTLYVLGGEMDIAYVNGMDDFAWIEHVPVVMANLNGAGHGGSYWEPNGGAAAEAVVNWLDWQLRGDAEAGAQFLGEDCGLCVDARWTVERKGID